MENLTLKKIKSVQMKIIIALLTAIMLLPIVFADSLSYSVILDYNEGELSLREILLIKAASIPPSEAGEYTAKIISFKDKILYETRFNINLEPFYSFPISKGTPKSTRELTRASLNLALPYFANAKSIQIFKGDKMLLEIDLAKFSTCNENNICESGESIESCQSDCTCGNEVCDVDENYLECSSDCPSGEKDNVCDKIADGICDPDCKNKDDYDCKATSGSKLLLYASIIAIAIVLILIFAKKIKKSDKNKKT